MTFMKSLQLNRPYLLILAGVPGSGRTTFGEQFAELFNAPYVNIKDFADLVSEVNLLPELGARIAEQYLKTGQTVLYEGLHGSRVEREKIAKLAEEAGYQPLILWFQVNQATANSRVVRKRKNTHENLAKVYANYSFTEPNDQEAYVVVSGMHTYTSQAKTVLKRMIDVSRSSRKPRIRKVATPKPKSKNRRPVKIS